MTRRVGVAMGLLGLVLACGCGGGGAPGPSADEQAAIDFVRGWCTAIQRNDADALARVLADDYVHTGSDGTATSRSDALAAARSRKVRYRRMESSDLVARVHGDTAVVTGRAVIEGTGRHGAPFETEIAFTDTLARVDGEWRAVAAHISRVPGG